MLKHFRLITAAAAGILLLSVWCASNPVSASHDPVVLINGTLIDGNGTAPLENAVVAVEDCIITYAGGAAAYQMPARARVYDVAGCTIMPGFFNCHVHSGYSSSNLKAWARAGVTAVRDLGNFSDTPAEAYAKRDALIEDARHATLIAAGPLVTTAGGYGSYIVFSVEDARQKISAMIAAGADLIKIAIEDDLQGRRWPLLPLEVIEEIVSLAHGAGIPVSAHVSRAAHLETALAAGVDDVCHMIVDELPDALIAHMIAQDMYWVPTLELWDRVSNRYDLAWSETAVRNLGRFVRAGGKAALGTDFDGFDAPFDLGMPVTEIDLMLEAGLTPLQVITAATKNAAAVCNREAGLGTLEAGKTAYILVVEGDPLQNTDALSAVRMVLHNGEVIRE